MSNLNNLTVNHTSSKFLSWPERIILAQSVLRALSNYTLMAIGMSKTSTKALEKITRDFLWGIGPTGRKRKPLITWTTFTKRKMDGGICWPALNDVADVFLLKNLVKILQNHTKDWVQLAQVMIHDRTLKRSCIGGRTNGRIHKLLLHVLSKPFWTLRARSSRQKFLLALCRKVRITTTTQLHDDQGQHMSIHQFCERNEVQVTHQQQITIDKVDTLMPPAKRENITWDQAAGWTWPDKVQTEGLPWKLTSKQWKRLIYSTKDDCNDLNQRWDRTDSRHKWTTRWKGLWEGDATFRMKIRCWRFMRKGCLTNAKLRDWGLDHGICRRCDIEPETVIQAIWQCPRLLERQRWVSRLFFKESERTTSQATGEQLWTALDKALDKNKDNPAYIILIIMMFRTNWLEGNKLQFEVVRKYLGISQILSEMTQEINALVGDRFTSEKREIQLKEAAELVSYSSDQSKR
ncbi:hypothetical protein R1sor_001614 [Riccia sorocarpa]|uniref:Reverse transcriptase zinc-binding domain-containing protein n=1 Tax=Riccia sorocarpa TaxID=122646 RepID=A0ABD3GYX9_9MARC